MKAFRINTEHDLMVARKLSPLLDDDPPDLEFIKGYLFGLSGSVRNLVICPKAEAEHNYTVVPTPMLEECSDIYASPKKS